MRWFTGIVGLGIVGGIALRLRYRKWLDAQAERVSADSKIVQTPLGQIEYDIRGQGSTVLHFHGGCVGHNGWFFLEHLVEAGYRLLTPDRPGYLGTPLDRNGSPEAQADLAAALLDTLAIDKVAVVAISAGGPAALQFALRHADRTEALVLLSAISRRTPLSEDQLNSTLGRLVMTPRFQNIVYFLINQAMKRMPALALQDSVRTETTYDMTVGKRYIDQILVDPDQCEQVMSLADAIVPAMPRFPGVMNDLKVQQELGELPLEQVRAPTLIVGSRYDGDIGYDNSVNSNARISGSTLITVEQFGHFIWWGDADVTRDFERRIEDFLARHVRPAGSSRAAPAAD